MWDDGGCCVFVVLSICRWILECARTVWQMFYSVCVCVRVFVFPTSKGDRGILVESDQRRVQQHRVHVLCDHTVVGRLDPRLVLVDCERDKTTYISQSFLFL